MNHFIIHARKALLGGNFSPADNRKIPPLKYDFVYSLIKDFPNLLFSINGGITSFEDAKNHLSQGVNGVMVGRSAINTPYYWRNIDSQLYNTVDPGKHFFFFKLFLYIHTVHTYIKAYTCMCKYMLYVFFGRRMFYL